MKSRAIDLDVDESTPLDPPVESSQNLPLRFHKDAVAMATAPIDAAKFRFDILYGVRFLEPAPSVKIID